MTDETLSLPDGRTLGYARYGVFDGTPVLYFHGGQESRLSGAFLDDMARQLNIHLVVPERPGVGLSSPQPNRTFQLWADDIRALTDALDISTFYVAGLSGGAPHVLAVLDAMPDRITKAAIISGAIPYDAPKSTKGMWFPVKMIHFAASRKSDKTLRKIMNGEKEDLDNNPDKKVRQYQKHLSEPDRELMKSDPDIAWEFIEGSKEAFTQGIDGVVQEWKLYVQPWNIDLASITTEVTLWYGEEDKMAPVRRGEYLDEKLPNSSLHVFDNEGHFSLIHHQKLTIFEDLINQ